MTKSRGGRAGVVLGMVLLVAMGAGSPAAQESPQLDEARQASDPAEDLAGEEGELLLIEARLDNRLLSSEMSAYQRGQRVLLPIGELARLLGIAIASDVGHREARGHVLDEHRTFYLDVERTRVILGGQERHFEAEQVLLQDDDIYVDSELLTQWLPLELNFDFSALALEIGAREPLPLQERFEREQRGRRLTAGTPQDDRDYPYQSSPYKLWEFPAIDLLLGLNSVSRDGALNRQAHLSALATGDLLGLESTLYFTDTTGAQTTGSSAPARFRFTLGRSDPEGQLLGPLRAREYALGSVALPQVGNVARAGSLGNGFGVSNAPLNQVFGVRGYALQGNLAPGWDVELYLNGSLIGFQPAGPGGRYLFQDIPLVYGANTLRLVFHGPQGQTRSEEKTVMLDPSLARPGHFYYRVVGQEDTAGRNRFVAQIDLGLGSQASLSGALVRMPLVGKDRLYVGVGAKAQWLSSLWTADLIRSDDGALAELALQTRLRGVGIGLSHARLFGGFASEEFLPSPDPVHQRSKLRLDWNWAAGRGLRLPVTLEARADHLQSGRINGEASARVSASLRRVAISHLLRWQDRGEGSLLDASLQVSSRLGRLGRLGVRGLVGYRLSGGAAFSSGSFLLDYSLGQGWRAQAGASRTVEPAETQISAGVTKNLGLYGLRLDLGHSRSRGTTVGVQLLVSMSRTPGGKWRFEATPAGDTGRAVAKVFWDKNLNGIEDAGDEPLAGVGFTVDGSHHAGRTDASGSAYLSRLPIRQYADIGIDVASIEDPQLFPKHKGLRILPRRGKTHELNFPVIATAEIDGTVYQEGRGGKSGVGGMAVEAVDPQGKVVSRAVSGSDGFYILEGVPPGTYELRLAKDFLQARGFAEAEHRIITVSPQADTVSGIDFALQQSKPNAGGSVQRGNAPANVDRIQPAPRR